MTEEYIKSLGWIKGELVSNRQFYHLGIGTIAVHLYDDSCYLVIGTEIKYDKEFTESGLEAYSDLLEAHKDMWNKPDEYSLKDYFDILNCFKEFYNKL